MDSGDDKTIKSLIKKFNMIVLDKNVQNLGILDYGALYEECADTRMETILPLVKKYTSSKHPPTADLIFSKVSVFKQQGSERVSEQKRYKMLSEYL